MKFKQFIKKYEFRRKVFHLFMGLAFVITINLNINLINTYLIQLVLAALLISTALSFYTKYYKPIFILKLLRFFDKPKDLIKFPGKGAVFYLVGILLAVSLFEKNIASASIMILAIGDPTAYFVGTHYGKKRLVINKRKLLEGTLAGTLLGTLGASFFVPMPIAFFGAAFGMIAEAIEFKLFHLDDNFFIPFVSGLTMQIIFSLV
jgi:phytol kinase